MDTQTILLIIGAILVALFLFRILKSLFKFVFYRLGDRRGFYIFFTGFDVGQLLRT